MKILTTKLTVVPTIKHLQILLRDQLSSFKKTRKKFQLKKDQHTYVGYIALERFNLFERGLELNSFVWII